MCGLGLTSNRKDASLVGVADLFSNTLPALGENAVWRALVGAEAAQGKAAQAP